MDTPVVIAGAGPVGLALAVGLAHQGVPSVVLEAKPRLSRHSKAPGVLPRTMEVFRAWGVLGEFLERGSFVSRPEIWVPGEPEPRVTIDLEVLRSETACPGILIIPQDRTEAILHDHAVRGRAEVRFGHRLVDFAESGDQVTVTVERQDGVRYTVRARYLAGCDGARSTVRDRLGWELEGKTYPTRLMLADVELPDARNALPWPRLAPRDEGLLAALRIEPALWRILATVPSSVPDSVAVREARVASQVNALFGPGPFALVWADTFQIHCRTSPHFRRGRVLLVGDAAHINSPAGGQGMNSGIQDAHNLAWKLARALRRDASERLVASYEAEQRPAILTNVDRYTDLLTRAFLLAPPLLRRLAAGLVRGATRHRATFRQIARRAAMLDTRYHPSPLVHGTGRWVGARAPDGPLRAAGGTEVRLLDLVARDAALLLFDDGRLPGWDVPAIERLLEGVPELRVLRVARGTSPGGPGLVDVSGATWDRWGPDPGQVALVRPDGHVGWMGQRPAADQLRDSVGRALGVAVRDPAGARPAGDEVADA